MGLITGWGTKILHAVWHGQKKRVFLKLEYPSRKMVAWS